MVWELQVSQCYGMNKAQQRKIICTEAMINEDANSDDPAYLGGYMNDNFVAIQQALDLNQDEPKQLAENSFTASFLDEVDKRKWLEQIQQL